MTPRHYLTLILLLALTLWLSPAQSAQFRVALPNGELRASVADLRVKVRGGQVSLERTWSNGRWYLNPAWADLKFRFNSEDGSVRYVDRAGAVYEKLGTGNVYVYDDRFFVAKTATGWRWYDRAGNEVRYDAEGRVVSYADRHGNSVQLIRTAGRLTSVRDVRDREVLRFEYTGDRVTRVVDAADRSVSYTWSATGNLDEVRDVLGYVWKYGYDANGQLTRVEDPEGRVTSVSYVQSFRAGGVAVPPGIGFSGKPGRDFRISRVSVLKDALERETRYSYVYNRQQERFEVVERSPLNRVTERWYDLKGRLDRQVEGERVSYERRRDGDLISYERDERGLIRRVERDAYRNVVLIEHPDGSSERWRYHPRFDFVVSHVDVRGFETRQVYDNRGNVVERIEALGTPEERRTEYTWTAAGELETLTQKSPSGDAVTRWTYDADGNVSSMTDAEDQVREYRDYTPEGMAREEEDARGHVWKRRYNAAGWLLEQESPLGTVIESRYDKVGNRTERRQPVSGTVVAVTKYRYDALNRLRETEDPLKGISKQTYDEDGRLRETEDASGVKTTMDYDFDGRLTTVTDAAGNVIRTVYGSKADGLEGLVAAREYPTYREEYRYDERDRVVQTRQVLTPTLSYVTKQAYDPAGNVVSVEDAKQRTSLRRYDALGRLREEIGVDGGVTRYRYDVRDQVLEVTDAENNTHRFSYDKIGRKLTEARPMGQTITYDYDPNGNVTLRESPNGAKRRYVYDEENRLTEERHFEPGSDTPSKTIRYDYDKRGLLTAYHDGKTSGSYEHDLRGLRERETIRFGTGASAITKTLERRYRANGQLESLTYPTSGNTTRKVDFAYNGNNQLETLTMPGSAGAIGYRYRWQSVDRVTYPGGVIRQITLDPLQRIERIQVGTQGEPTGILDHRYRYDEVSNIREKDTREGRYDYGYDELDRLTEATPPVALQVNDTNPEGLPIERYRYDRVHNRLESDHQPGTWIYNANNELQSYGTGVERRVLSYDANGSTVREERGDPAFQVTDYVYDPQDRLIEVKRDGVTQVEYAYDPFGQRIWRETKPASVEGATVTWFLYSREGLIGEYRADGSAIREYGWLPNGLWGTDPVWQHDATGTHVMHNDHLFTPERMTRAGESAVSWAGNREAFGRVAVQPGSSTTMLLRFPGQWEDGVGGFYQNWWREYGAAVGRYRSVDPIMLNDLANDFVYARLNPLTHRDGSGLSSECCKIKLPPSPYKEVALTCYAETEGEKGCPNGDARDGIAAMISTVANRARSRDRSLCAENGDFLAIVSCAYRGNKQYEGYRNEKYLNGEDPSALNDIECKHLQLCIASAFVYLVEPKFDFMFFVAERVAQNRGTTICGNRYRRNYRGD